MKTGKILLTFLIILAVNFVSADCIDNDNDGYGLGCELGEDCNDNNILTFRWMDFYLDEDHDIFGTGEVIQTACWGVGSYFIYPLDERSFNKLDCDDLNRHINPSIKEILDNGIDENCDGRDGYISYFEYLMPF